MIIVGARHARVSKTLDPATRRDDIIIPLRDTALFPFSNDINGERNTLVQGSWNELRD